MATKCENCGFISDAAGEICPACKMPYASKRAEKKPPVSPKSPDATKVGEDDGKWVNSSSGASFFEKYVDVISDDKLFTLALAYKNGTGVEKNEELATRAFLKLAERGYAPAMHQYALALLAKPSPDFKRAVFWLKLAADSGNKESAIKLKVLKEDGIDVGSTRSSDFDKSKVEKEAGESLAKLAEEALKYVVTVFTCDGQGSGVIINGGYVITNYHVVGKRKDVGCEFDSSVGGKRYKLIPVALSPQCDIAVLRFADKFADKKYTENHLNLKTERPEIGESVYVLGNPLGVGMSLCSGVIACPSRYSRAGTSVDDMIQINMTINHGNSGGALIDMQNNVLGMPANSLVINEYKLEGHAFCVAANRVADVINEYERYLSEQKGSGKKR